MTTCEQLEELYTKEEIDLYDYMTISLHDGYADYCYNKNQVRTLISRLRRYMRDSALITKMNEGTENMYFHILPVKIYKMCSGKPRLIKGMSIGSDNIPNSYKVVFEGSKEFPSNIVIKDFKKSLDMNVLYDIIELTNEQNQ